MRSSQVPRSVGIWQSCPGMRLVLCTERTRNSLGPCGVHGRAPFKRFCCWEPHRIGVKAMPLSSCSQWQNTVGTSANPPPDPGLLRWATFAQGPRPMDTHTQTFSKLYSSLKLLSPSSSFPLTVHRSLRDSGDGCPTLWMYLMPWSEL